RNALAVESQQFSIEPRPSVDVLNWHDDSKELNGHEASSEMEMGPTQSAATERRHVGWCGSYGESVGLSFLCLNAAWRQASMHPNCIRPFRSRVNGHSVKSAQTSVSKRSRGLNCAISASSGGGSTSACTPINRCVPTGQMRALGAPF